MGVLHQLAHLPCRPRAGLAAGPARPAQRDPARLDLRGLVLLASGLGAVVYGLSEAGLHDSFAALAAWLPLAIGAALLAGYAVHALTSRAEPIIDLRLFTVRSFAASASLLFLLGASLFGAMFLLPLYYQQAQHASVLHAGLLLAPLGAGMGLAMAYAGKLIDRTGAERAITLTAMTLAVAASRPTPSSAATPARSCSAWRCSSPAWASGQSR